MHDLVPGYLFGRHYREGVVPVVEEKDDVEVSGLDLDGQECGSFFDDDEGFDGFEPEFPQFGYAVAEIIEQRPHGAVVGPEMGVYTDKVAGMPLVPCPEPAAAHGTFPHN